MKFKDLLHRVKGIKGIYPLVPFPEKIRGYIALIRAFTCFGAFMSGLLFSIFAFRYYGQTVNWIQAIGAGLALALLQGAGQALNQSLPEEIEIDKINGKTYRPTVRGIIKPREARNFSAFLIISGLAIAAMMSYLFLMLACVISFFAVFYTYPPLRVKRFFILNNVHQGIARGFMPVISVWSIAGNLSSPVPYALGTVIAIWIVGAQSTKDFGDEEGDRRFNIRTLPVVLGFERALNFMSLVMCISLVLLTVFCSWGLLPVRLLLLGLLIIPSLLIVHGLRKGYKHRLLENNLSWAVYYVSLMLWYALPAVAI